MITDKNILSLIRDIHDFPKKGIIFKDITPLLANPEAFKTVIKAFSSLCVDKNITKVVAIEARGFIFGTALAYDLGVGLVPVRKKGKLPGKKISAGFALEYGTDEVEIHADALCAEDKVIIVDDLLATGGTMQAAIELVERLGAQVVQAAFLCELKFLNGRAKIKAPLDVLIGF